MTPIKNELGKKRIKFIGFNLTDHIVKDYKTILLESWSLFLRKFYIVFLVSLINILR